MRHHGSVRKAIVTIVVLAALALMVVPLALPWRATRNLAAAEREAEIRPQPIARSRGNPAPGAPLLTPRRIPETLAEPVTLNRIATFLEPVTRGWPEPSCLVVYVGEDRVLDFNGDAALTPASVEKLMTAVTAMDDLDPTRGFTTSIVGEPPTAGGVVEGDVWMVGGGDPVLATREYAESFRRQPQLFTPLEDLADAIVAAGVTRIRGRILGDDSRYDRVRFLPAWPERYRSQKNAGPIGALAVNDGFTEWDPVRVEAGDPAAHAAAELASLLAERGVAVGGTGIGVAPPDGVPIARVESAPLAEIVREMLRESDNDTAESLIRELGLVTSGVGTTEAGARAVEAAVAERVPDSEAVEVHDGSGLSPSDTTSCGVLASLLVEEGPDSVIGTGLAVAGETGTLAHRFIDTPVAGRLHAKTGLLNHVNGLAGFVEPTDPGGPLVTFAQLLNGVPLEGRVGLDLQEQLALVLVDLPEGPDIGRIAGAGDGK